MTSKTTQEQEQFKHRSEQRIIGSLMSFRGGKEGWEEMAARHEELKKEFVPSPAQGFNDGLEYALGTLICEAVVNEFGRDEDEDLGVWAHAERKIDSDSSWLSDMLKGATEDNYDDMYAKARELWIYEFVTGYEHAILAILNAHKKAVEDAGLIEPNVGTVARYRYDEVESYKTANSKLGEAVAS